MSDSGCFPPFRKYWVHFHMKYWKLRELDHIMKCPSRLFLHGRPLTNFMALDPEINTIRCLFVVRLLSAMICISPRDSLNYSALCLQQLGRSCVCVCVYVYIYGTPLQYSCLENPMDRGAWWAAVHGVAKRST